MCVFPRILVLAAKIDSNHTMLYSHANHTMPNCTFHGAYLIHQAGVEIVLLCNIDPVNLTIRSYTVVHLSKTVGWGDK